VHRTCATLNTSTVPTTCVQLGSLFATPTLEKDSSASLLHWFDVVQQVPKQAPSKFAKEPTIHCERWSVLVRARAHAHANLPHLPSPLVASCCCCCSSRCALKIRVRPLFSHASLFARSLPPSCAAPAPPPPHMYVPRCRCTHAGIACCFSTGLSPTCRCTHLAHRFVDIHDPRLFDPVQAL
jgi:hypothetical protein